MPRTPKSDGETKPVIEMLKTADLIPYARCAAADVAFFHKQSAGHRTEMGIELDGKIVREYPRHDYHPSLLALA